MIKSCMSPLILEQTVMEL